MYRSMSRLAPCTASSAQNGGGKTTTIRLLLGLLRADGGTVKMLGHDVLRGVANGARATHPE